MAVVSLPDMQVYISNDCGELHVFIIRLHNFLFVSSVFYVFKSQYLGRFLQSQKFSTNSFFLYFCAFSVFKNILLYFFYLDTFMTAQQVCFPFTTFPFCFVFGSEFDTADSEQSASLATFHNDLSFLKLTSLALKAKFMSFCFVQQLSKV